MFTKGRIKLHRMPLHQFYPPLHLAKYSAQSTPSPELLAIMNHFDAPVRFAFGYGSGVFPQSGAEKTPEKPMIDLVFGVTHPEHWHSLNMRQNRHHYSSLASFVGSQGITRIQEKSGAFIYYNPYVTINGITIKYGVISIDALLRDLKEWETLYIAGRMQKPIQVLRPDPRVRLANKENLYNAMRIALLILPEKFSEEELFFTIAGLSYKGDFRMRYGENPYKVYNIVYKQREDFRQLYNSIIQDLPNVVYTRPNEELEQDMEPKLRRNLLQALPAKLISKVQNHHRWYLSRISESLSGEPGREPGFTNSLINSPELSIYLNKGLSEIISAPAWAQSIKGLFSAGPMNSIAYVMSKLRKRSSALKRSGE